MRLRITFRTLACAASIIFALAACSLSPAGQYTPTPTPAPPLPTATESLPGLAGKWLDTDTGTYHVIAWQGDGYVVTETVNPGWGTDSSTESKWDGVTLTWTYCVPGGNCVTTHTVSVSGDALQTTWENDQGYSGEATLTRMKP